MSEVLTRTVDGVPASTSTAHGFQDNTEIAVEGIDS
jgi:hypothetical protein